VHVGLRDQVTDLVRAYGVVQHEQDTRARVGEVGEQPVVSGCLPRNLVGHVVRHAERTGMLRGVEELCGLARDLARVRRLSRGKRQTAVRLIKNAVGVAAIIAVFIGLGQITPNGNVVFFLKILGHGLDRLVHDDEFVLPPPKGHAWTLSAQPGGGRLYPGSPGEDKVDRDKRQAEVWLEWQRRNLP
jgi:hypothetical protein